MRLTIILFSILLFAACKKDEPAQQIANTITLNTDEGSQLEITGGGKTETITGTYVNIGGGQLLNQNFFRQFNISTPNGTLFLRFSFPYKYLNSIDENLYKEHSLFEYPLKLEDSGYINEVVAEVYFPTSSFFASGNASGSVNLKSNYSVNGISYSVFGDVEFALQGKDGIRYFVKGYFWKK